MDTDGQDNVSMPVLAEALKQREFVAAIDFGTTYSGYAFQSRAEFDADPLSISTSSEDTGNRGLSRKIPSCILFDKNKKFHSFGSDAERKYNEAVSNGEHFSWHFFKRFKMALYNKNTLTRTTTMPDDNGSEMSAMKVILSSIIFLKADLLKTLQTLRRDVEPSQIHWVITVPAIWSDAAKRFMREAAIEADIDTDKLSLSLEPEAASLFCRYLPVVKVQGVDRSEIRSLKTGEKYMILDAGGGTVDITVHEILKDGTLKELSRSNGGDWGGTKVDEKFKDLLDAVFGADVIEVIMQHFRDDFLELMQTFEIQKRSVNPASSDPTTVRIPASFIDQFKEMNNFHPENGTLPAQLKGKVTFSKDRMRIDIAIMKGLFTEVCDQICAIADEFFQSVPDHNINTILMVGGFSDSAMLQDKVRKTFPRCRIIIPEDAGLAVLKGAVLFGHNPSMIVARICRYSYGIRAFKHFETSIDPPDKKVIQGRFILCKDYFSKHATIGEEFNTEAKVYTKEYLPSDATGSELEVCIFTSQKKYPLYTDEDGATKVGEMRVSLKDLKGEGNPLKIQFMFGKTELEVKVIDTYTSKEVKCASFEIL